MSHCAVATVLPNSIYLIALTVIYYAIAKVWVLCITVNLVSGYVKRNVFALVVNRKLYALCFISNLNALPLCTLANLTCLGKWVYLLVRVLLYR